MNRNLAVLCDSRWGKTDALFSVAKIEVHYWVKRLYVEVFMLGGAMST